MRPNPVARRISVMRVPVALLLGFFAVNVAASAQSQPQSQSESQPQSFADDLPTAAISSSAGPNPASDPDPLPEAPVPHFYGGGGQAEYTAEREPRPFHSLAVGLTLGTGGIGVELATPINTKLNLRGGASFFSYNTSFIVDTIPITGALHLSNINAEVDYFPRARSFHISPGITFYDNTRFNATIFVPGNQVVVFNDQNYTSDPNDPIRGTADISFGRTVAPRLTVGFGNVIRHHTAHLTFPFEIGAEYIKTPSAIFNLTGSSCDAPNDCNPINSDPETQENITEQQNEINADVKPFRIFPIITFGVSYKFGH